MAVGLRNEAELRLKVTLDSKNINGTKKLLENLANAFNASKANKQFDLMEQNLIEVKNELKAAKAEMAAMQAAMNKQAAAASKAAAAQKRNKGAMVEANAHVKAYQQSLKQTAATFAMMSVMLVQGAARQKQAAAATQGAIAVQKAQAAAAQRNAAAIKANAAAQAAAAGKSKQLTAAEMALHHAVKMGPTFVYRNVKAINALRQAMASGSKNVDSYAQALRNLINTQRTQNRMSRGRQFMGVNLGMLDQIRERVSEFEHRMDALFRASLRLNIVGQQLQRWGQNILRWGGDIMDTFGEFEFTMLRAAGALEIWTDKPMEGAENGLGMLQDRLLELTNEMARFSANEVAEALYFWGSATGQVVNNAEDLEVAMSGLDKIMKVATMTNTDYETTIKGVYSIITQFYNGALGEMDSVTEKLFLTTQKTAAEFNDLIQSFKMVGPVAAQVGADFDEVNEIFGTLSDLGLRGSLAGRGLRQFFIQLIRPSGPAQNAINSLWDSLPDKLFGGQSFRDVAFPEGEFVGITQHVENLARATMHLEDAERAEFLARITTANSLPLMTALVAKASRELKGMAENVDKFADADPATFFKKNWDALAGSWDTARKSLDRVVETLKITLGSQMAVALKPLIETLKGIVESVHDFVKTHPEMMQMATTFLAIAAAVSIAAGAAFTLGGALVGLGAAIYLVWQSVSPWAGTILKAAGAIGILTVAVAENIDVLYMLATNVIDNLSEAFDNLFGGVEELAIGFLFIMDNATEFMGILLEVAGRVTEFVTGILAAITAIEPLAGVLKIVGAAIALVFSGLVIGSIMSMAKAFALLLGQMVASRVVAFLRPFKYMQIIIQRNTVSLVAMRKILWSMAPGFIGIGIAVAMLAYDLFPGFKDIVDGIVGSFKDMNTEINESAEIFGSTAGAVIRVAKNWANAQASVTAETERSAEAQQEWMDATTRETELITTIADRTAAAVSGVWDFGDNGTPFIEERMSIEEFGRETKVLQEELIALQARLAEMDSENFQAALDAGTKATALALGLTDEAIDGLVGDYNRLREAQIGAGVEALMSAEDFAVAAVLLTNYSDIIDNVDIAGDEVLRLITEELTSSMTPQEVQRLWEKEGERLGIGRTAFSTLLDRSGVDIGAATTSYDEFISGTLDEILQNTDSTALGLALAEPLVELGGLSLIQAMEEGILSPEASRMVGEAIVQQQTLAVEQAENAAAGLGTGALKTALLDLTTFLFQEALPNANDIAFAIQTATAYGDWDELGRILLEETFADGTRIIDDLERAGDYGTQWKSIAEALIEAGLAPQELIDLMADIAEETGEEAGEETAESFNKAFLESLSEMGDISVKDFKEASKLGSMRERVNKATKALYKANQKGFIDNPESRALARKTIRQGANAGIARAQDQADRGVDPQKTLNKTMKNLFPKNFKDLPSSVQKAAIRMGKKIGRKFPDEVAAAIATVDGLTELEQEALLASMFPPPPAPTIEAAMETLLGGTNAESAATKAAESVIEDATAKVEEVGTAGEDLGAQMIDGLKTGVSNAITQGASGIISTITKSVHGAATAEGRPVFSTGKWLGRDMISGFKTGVSNNISGASTHVSTKLQGLETSVPAKTYGINIGKTFAQGVEEGISSYAINVSGNFTAAIEAQSPPKKGTLSKIDKWGLNVGEVYAESVGKGINKGFEIDNQFSGMNITRTGKKEITIKLEVSSPDGTANRQKQGEVRKAALDAFAIAGIEHMATVG